MNVHPGLPPSPLTAWAWWDRALHIAALTGDPICAAIIPDRARDRGQRYRPVREGLLWRLPCGALARIDESGMLASIPGDRALPMPLDGLLRLAHPWSLDEAEWSAWQDVAFEHTIIPADWQAPWTMTAGDLVAAFYADVSWPDMPDPDWMKAAGWRAVPTHRAADLWCWPADGVPLIDVREDIEGLHGPIPTDQVIGVMTDDQPLPRDLDGPALFRALGPLAPSVSVWIAAYREGALRGAA
jgi:hypothetical protein